ncbi:MAG: tetratricopeptide repeat protein [bacterium]
MTAAPAVPPTPIARTNASASLPALFAALGAVFIVLCAFAAFRNSPRLWGLHSLAFLPAGFRIAALLAAAAVCAPLVSRRAGAIAERLAASLPEWRSWRVRALTAAGAVVLFWGLRDRAHLFGDGPLLIESVESGRWWAGFEGLDFAVHAAVYRVIGLFGSTSGALSYAIVSVIAGLLYIAAAHSFGGTIGRSPREKTFVVSVLLSLGFAQVFFGYAEAYAFAFPIALLYFRSCYCAIAGRGPLWKPVVLYVLLVVLHVTFAASALSLGVVVFHRLRANGSAAREALPRAAAAAGALGIALGAALLAAANRVSHGDVAKRAADHVLPLVMSDHVNRHATPYALVSARHATNLVNEVFLVVPGIVVLLLALLLAGEHRRLRLLHSSHAFFLVCTCAAWIPQSLGFAFFRPGYAAFGDWDLLALPAVGFAVSVASAAIVLVSRERLVAIGIATCALQGLTLVPHVLVNADRDRGVTRYLYQLRGDTEAWDVYTMGIGYGHVVRQLSADGDARRAEEVAHESLRVIAWSPSLFEQQLAKFAAQIEDRGETERAREFYESKLDAVLPNARSVNELVAVCASAGEFFYRRADFRRACGYFERAAQADSNEYNALYLLAASQREERLLDKARESIAEAIRRTPAGETGKKARGYLILSGILEDAGENARALEAINAGLAIDPENRDLRDALAAGS